MAIDLAIVSGLTGSGCSRPSAERADHRRTPSGLRGVNPWKVAIDEACLAKLEKSPLDAR